MLRKWWAWIAAGAAAVGAALVAWCLWLYHRGGPHRGTDAIVRDLVDAARSRAGSGPATEAQAARARAVSRAVEAERRARELSRGALDDPDGVLKRHRKP